MTIYTTQQEPLKTKLVQGNVTVYNLKTGAADSCAPVDARERVARGGWSFTAPFTIEPQDLVTGSPFDVPEEDEPFIPDETDPPKRAKKKGR